MFFNGQLGLARYAQQLSLSPSTAAETVLSNLYVPKFCQHSALGPSLHPNLFEAMDDKEKIRREEMEERMRKEKMHAQLIYAQY